MLLFNASLEQVISDFSYPGYDMHFHEFQIIEKYDYFAPIKHFKSGHDNTKYHYILFSLFKIRVDMKMLYLFLKLRVCSYI